jgi:hypothetical protein
VFNRINGGAAALVFARQLTGEPYRFGGSAPGPTDCSGLWQWAYEKIGVHLPRTTYLQYDICQIPDSEPSQPGDLLFIPGSDAQGVAPGHVMGYVKPGWVFQAPFTGENIGEYKYDTSQFEYRTRPALVLAPPSPTTKQLHAAQLTPIRQATVARAVEAGWPIYTWDWRAKKFITAVPQTQGQRYISIFYPKGKP